MQQKNILLQLFKFSKAILLIIVATISVISCSSDKQSEHKNLNLNDFINTYFKNFNQYKWDSLAAMYSNEAEFKDPSMGKGIAKMNRSEFIQKYKSLQEQIPQLHDSIVHTYVSDEKHIVVEFISSGISPDGMKFELPICTIFTIDNGLISKDYTYYDNQ